MKKYTDECLVALYPGNEAVLRREEVEFRGRCPVFVRQLEQFIARTFPARLDDAEVSEEYVRAFRAWAQEHFVCERAIERVGEILHKLGANEALRDALESTRFDVEPYMQHYEAVVRSKPGLRRSAFATHVREFVVAREGVVCDDKSALAYCGLSDARLYVLREVGGLGEERWARVAEMFARRRASVQERYEKFVARGMEEHKRDDVKQRKAAPQAVYLELLNVMGVVAGSDLGSLGADAMFDALQHRVGKTVNRAVLFDFLRFELQEQGAHETLRALEQRLPYAFTRVCGFDTLCARDEWHRVTVGRLKELLTSHSQTSFRETLESEMRVRVANCVGFLEEEYGTTLRDFLEQLCAPGGADCGKCARCVDYPRFVARYADKRQVQNNKVKSSLQLHSANQPVTNCYQFVKKALVKLVPQVDNASLKVLNQAQVVRRLENQRVAADPSVERTFTEEEVKRILEAVKDNPAHVLLVTLLREIGLRISAALHLRVNDLYDPQRARAREVCKVLEKKKSLREFVTSTNLKSKIEYYVSTLTSEQRASNCPLFYPHKPLTRRMVAELFRKVKAKAGVAANLHAHAFRHTLVSTLIEEGNPVEVVSRFLGHNSSRTTETHYYVSTVRQLAEKMNNPFTGQFHRKRRAHELSKLDLEVMAAKKQKLLELVFQYNSIIAENAQAGRSARDVYQDLMAKIPNLQELLQSVDDDE